MTFRLMRALLIGALTSSAALGCAHVAPYERSKLAHPSMKSEGLVGPGSAHVRSVLEGASGGSLGAEAGGCGCN